MSRFTWSAALVVGRMLVGFLMAAPAVAAEPTARGRPKIELAPSAGPKRAAPL